MADVRHLGFVKFKLLTVGEVKRPILHQRTKFRKDRSNRCGDIAIFVISFQYGGRRHLGFSKILNFNGWSAAGGQCASACQISSVAEIWRFYLFSKWRPSAILVVSIVMPNLVKIDAVVSITWNFQYFARLAWKRLFTPPKLGLGVFHLQIEEQYQRNPQMAHPCACPRRLSHEAWKFVNGSDL